MRAAMNVYRVEKEDGEGPYFWSASRWTRRTHSSMSGHPNPYDDEGLKHWLNMIKSVNPELLEDYARKYSFGFKSMKDLEAWFNEDELKNLKKLGFNIVVYAVDIKNVIAGHKQVMFRKDLAVENLSVKYCSETGKKIAA